MVWRQRSLVGLGLCECDELDQQALKPDDDYVLKVSTLNSPTASATYTEILTCCSGLQFEVAH